MNKILIIIFLLVSVGCSMNKTNQEVLVNNQQSEVPTEVKQPKVWGLTSKDQVLDEKPRPSKHVRPDFSEMDPNVKSAKVVLEVEIFTDGTVGQINVIETGGEYMDAQVIKAIRLWRFHPGSINGVPVDCWVTFPIGYQIDN
jgi:TonB family protein